MKIGFSFKRVRSEKAKGTPAAAANVPLLIRKAEMRDAGAVAVILRDTGWWETIQSESLDMTHERVLGHVRLCNADRSHTLYVAEQGGEIIGYTAVHWLPYLFLAGPEGYVSELFVLRKSRGRGIGTLLLEAVKKEARERGCSRLMLVNGRRRDSYKRRYYRKHGWQERQDIANFILPFN